MILKTLLLILLLSFVSLNATILVDDTFEGSLSNWSLSGGAYPYTYKGSGINFATKGSGAVAVPTAFDEGILTLTNSLRLHSNQATSVTINFSYEWDQTNATRYVCIDYSNDGGRTWTNDIGDIISWGSFTGMRTLGSFSKTLDEKTVGSFTDSFKFRIRGKDGGSKVTAYIDDVEIIGTDVVPVRAIQDDIPEPSTILFIVWVFTLLAFRHRMR